MKDQVLSNQTLLEENALLRKRIQELEQSKSYIELAKEEQTKKLEIMANDLNVILENIPLGISKIIDREQAWVNRTTEELFQYSKEEMEFQTTRKLYPSDEAYEKLGREAYPILAQGAVFSTVQELIRKDGVHIFVRYIGKAVEPPDMSKGTIWLLEDITERKRVEDELLRARQWLSLHVQQTPLAVIEFDLRGRVRGWNPAAVKIFGFSPHEAIGQYWQFMVPPRVWESLDGIWEGLVSRRGGSRSTNTNVTKSGQIIDCEWFNTPLVDLQGNTIGVASLVMDVTKRRQAEKEREQFFKFFQTSADLMCIADPNGAFMKTNPACTEVLGYSEAELVSKPFIEFIHPEDKQETLDEMARQIQRGSSLNFENRYICKDGSIKWLSWRANYNKDEGITYAAARDISDRKWMEEKLQESEERFRSFFETTADLVCIAEIKGYFCELSDSWEKVLGYSKQELIQKSFVDFIHLEDREKTLQVIKEKLERGITVISFENRYLRKDGGFVWLEWTSRPIPEKGLTFAIARDITERKQAEEKIRASLLEKETMLKEIHHRVKNNLQVITSLLDMQSSYLEDGKARKALQESMARVRTMAMIHTQLYQSLDLTKIDFGLFIRDLISNISQSYGRVESPVKINVDAVETRLGIDSSIPCGLILNELVSNALKHAFPGGKGGEINIRMRSEDNRVVLAVQDNGIGFPKSVDFTNVKSLGLQLVTVLVGQMNGKIDLQVDGGTTWAITFSVKKEREWRNG